MKPKEKQPKPKVLLLGWDAADWKVINPLIEQGLMPNLEKLINKGVMGKLSTLDPSFSPMLWSSIATGKRPYKHGVHGFIEVTPDGKGVRPVMSTSRKCRAIWNMLTLKKMKSHVVGWWPSHPAEPINGTMISNFFQKAPNKIGQPWPLAKGTVHPFEDSEHFAKFRVHPEELTGQHILPFIPLAHKIDQKTDRRIGSVAKITTDASSLHAAFTNIIREREWDFAALYLDSIDHYCHGFMKFHPPKRPHITQQDYDYYNYVVTAGYRFHDMMLRRIMDLIDDDTTLILVSDHGFQPDHLRPRNIPQEPAGPAYEHSPYGIFIAAGPGIKKDEIIYGASLLDITPTILKIFDLPVAKDMDGKVLENIFEVPTETSFIDSWEDIKGEDGKLHDTNDVLSDEASAAALKQLEDLGYIEKQKTNVEAQIKSTKDNTDYNLARAYIDGGEIAKGRAILSKLVEENPEVPWFWFRLAIAQQMSAQNEEARASIQQLRTLNVYEEETLDIMEASLLIAERKPNEAIDLLKKVEKSKPKDSINARVNLQLARSYSMIGRWKDAEKCLHKEVAHDPDNASVHHLLSRNYLQQKRFTEAADAALNALSLEFNNASYHFALSRALFDLGEYKDASNALEKGLIIQPKNNAARELLKNIYKNHLGDIEKYDFHRLQQSDNRQKTIYIVSGLPRSGTSMAMQMLEAGGLSVFTDGKREADENNNKGYLEHEAVKSLARNKKWINAAEGKAVKVITQLVRYLPLTYNYKVIYMERDLTEIMASQQKMLVRLGKQTNEETYPLKIAEQYKQSVIAVKHWASERDNVEILYVDYNKALHNPLDMALTLRDFTGKDLAVEKMVSVVDKNLYRERYQEMKTE